MEVGEKKGKLTLLRLVKKQVVHYKTYGEYLCDCGEVKLIEPHAVKTGRASSCGCGQREWRVLQNKKVRMTTHGMAQTREYVTWQQMKQRCLNKNSPNFSDYGGRGITLDERWLKFENFYADMGTRPEGMSLERIDNSGGYCKENCRWADRQGQQNNTRRNVYLTYNGKMQSMKKWAEELGLSYPQVTSRRKRGLSVEEVLDPNARNTHLISHNGKTQNIKEWAKELGLSADTLRARIHLGWSDEKVITYKKK